MKLKSLLLVALMMFSFGVFAQNNFREGLQEYKLENGLTVFLWEDPTASSVHGRVV